MTTVVLHHGLLGGGINFGRIQWRGFQGIEVAIADAGFSVAVSSVHPTAGIKTRAIQLKRWIRDNTPASSSHRIVLIAHSMGGLDARWMISRLGMADRVAVLLTVCAPHRGSAFADWFVQHVGRLGAVRLAQKMGLDITAANDLTTESCARFNELAPNHPEVKYFSVAASRMRRDMPAFALHSHGIIYKAQGPNDGLVAIASAKWGTHLATWRADHWQTVNHRYSIRKKHQPRNIPEHYLAVLRAAMGK